MHTICGLPGATLFEKGQNSERALSQKHAAKQDNSNVGFTRPNCKSWKVSQHAATESWNDSFYAMQERDGDTRGRQGCEGIAMI